MFQHARLLCQNAISLCTIYINDPHVSTLENADSHRKELKIRQLRPLLKTYLNALHPRMLCAAFSCNWSSDPEKIPQNFKRSLMYFYCFPIIFSWAVTIMWINHTHFKKHWSSWSGENFLNVFNVFSLCHYFPSFEFVVIEEQIWILCTQRLFSTKSVEVR